MIKWIKRRLFKPLTNMVCVEGLQPYRAFVYSLSYDEDVRIIYPTWWENREAIEKPTREIAEKLLEARKKGVLSLSIPSPVRKATVDGSVLAGEKDSGNVLKIGITSKEGRIKIVTLFVVYNGKSAFYSVEGLFNQVEKVFLINLIRELHNESKENEERVTRDKITNNLSHMLL